MHYCIDIGYTGGRGAFDRDLIMSTNVAVIKIREQPETRSSSPRGCTLVPHLRAMEKVKGNERLLCCMAKSDKAMLDANHLYQPMRVLQTSLKR